MDLLSKLEFSKGEKFNENTIPGDDTLKKCGFSAYIPMKDKPFKKGAGGMNMSCEQFLE